MMNRSLESTDVTIRGSAAVRRSGTSRAALGLAVTLLVGLTASGVLAHGDAKHEPDVSTGRSADFEAPIPGTYSLPPLGPAANGDVLESDGAKARLHDLFGADVVLLSFVYTRCSDADGCPLATASLHAVGGLLARESEIAARVRLLSLSFDPQNDTPEVMRAYRESFRRDGLDWRFLTTSSEEALAPMLSAYRQTRVREVDDGGEETGQYAHLLRVFLIDSDKTIRQVYSASLLDATSLVADVKTLLLEGDAQGTAGPTTAASDRATASDLIRPGDDRTGYESADYTTRSQRLAARRGRAADLFGRMNAPPLGLPAAPVPEDNPLTREKIELGRRLFFERRLSHNDTLSCAMCHIPEQGFANNEMATAVGIEGRSVRRNSPSLYNVAYLRQLFHDGRETRLEHQIWGPLLARNEMGNPSVGAVLTKLGRIEGYAAAFERAFPGRGLTMSTLGDAFASYQRTLVSGDSPFDRFLYGGDSSALSTSAQRGFALFSGGAGCSGCHSLASDHALFMDDAFHNTGMGFSAAMGEAAGGQDAGNSSGDTQRVQVAPGAYLEVPRAIIAQVSERPANDLGRYEITRDPRDRWRYRTPSLRNVALSAPYMHDGSLATLRDVIEFYRRGGVSNEGLDPQIQPLQLAEADVEDLVSFLESLTGSDVALLVEDALAAPIGDPTSSPPRTD
jgi:cytochrome c peroxidase